MVRTHLGAAQRQDISRDLNIGISAIGNEIESLGHRGCVKIILLGRAVEAEHRNASADLGRVDVVCVGADDVESALQGGIPFSSRHGVEVVSGSGAVKVIERSGPLLLCRKNQAEDALQFIALGIVNVDLCDIGGVPMINYSTVVVSVERHGISRDSACADLRKCQQIIAFVPPPRTPNTGSGPLKAETNLSQAESSTRFATDFML